MLDAVSWVLLIRTVGWRLTDCREVCRLRQPRQPAPVLRVLVSGREEGHEAGSLSNPEGACYLARRPNAGGVLTICEEYRTGKCIPDNPLANATKDLHHAAEPDVHGAGQSVSLRVAKKDIHNCTTHSTGTTPTHEHHRIGSTGNQEAQQRDWGGVAKILAQFGRRRRVLGTEVQLLKGIAWNRQQHALRGLHLAESLRIGGIVLLGGVAGHVDASG